MVIFLSEAMTAQPETPQSRPFDDPVAIRRRIVSSKNYKHDGSSPESAGALLIFQTDRQQTWLVATPKRLYCILDDVANAEPKVQWSEKLESFVDEKGRMLAEIRTRNRSERIGLVDIGSKHADWLFSRKLFTLTPIERQIESLVKSQVTAD